MSATIEKSFDLSFIRLSCSSYMTLADHACLFHAVHDKHRNGLSLQNYIETVKPKSEELFPYILNLLSDHTNKSQDKIVCYLLNYLLGIPQETTENVVNVVNVMNENKKPKLEISSYLRKGFIDIPKQKESGKIDNRKIFFFMISMYRHRNLQKHQLESLDRYFEYIITSGIVDTCISTLFQVILSNRQISVSNCNSNLQSIGYLHTNEMTRLLYHQVSGFVNSHFSNQNNCIYAARYAMVCGNKQALTEIINILLENGMSKTNIFCNIVGYSESGQQINNLHGIEVSSRFTIPPKMIDFVISILNVSPKKVYERMIRFERSWGIGFPPRERFAFFSLKVKLYELINKFESEAANFMLPNLLKDWQQLNLRYSVVTNESVVVVNDFTEFDEFIYSKSFWQNIVDLELQHDMLDSFLQDRITDTTKSLLSLPAHRLPCWVTQELMNSVKEEFESRQQNNQQNTQQNIPNFKLEESIFRILTPPPFSEFSACELAILIHNEIEFWNNFKKETNLVVKQRAVLLICSIGNVPLLSKIPFEYVNPNVCWLFGMISKQKEILDYLSLNFKIDINCCKIRGLLDNCVVTTNHFYLPSMDDYLNAEFFDFKQNDSFCSLFSKYF